MGPSALGQGATGGPLKWRHSGCSGSGCWRDVACCLTSESCVCMHVMMQMMTTIMAVMTTTSSTATTEMAAGRT